MMLSEGHFHICPGQSVETRLFLRLAFSLFFSFLSLIMSFFILVYCYSLCKLAMDLCVGVCCRQAVVDTDV